MQNVSSTVNLLLASLQLSLGTINKKNFELANNECIDWDIFNNLVKFHKVHSLIHDELSKNIKAYFPDNTLTLLEYNHRINAAGNLLLSAELIKTSNLFEENNIPVLVIKGLSVSNWLYKNSGLRSSGDIDILINSSHWKLALDSMKSIGYEMSSIDDRLELGSQLSRQFIRTVKDVSFINKKNNVSVELHWRFAPNRDVFPLDFDEAWKARSEFSIRGNSIQQLSDEMHALYLCYHGAKHGWDKLFWLYDIALLMLNNKTDWDLILEFSKQYKATISLGLAVVLASRVFLIPVPKAVNQHDDIIKIGWRLSDEIINKIMSDRPIETSSGMSSMSKGVTWRSRISPLRAPLVSEWLHYLTSPGISDWESIKLPDYLTSLYRVLRPFRLIAKGFFGSKS